jgi:hypothetical protein
VALAGSIMSISGMILGFIRKRKKRKPGLFGFSPYKKKWQRWHHITGYIFGFFVLTFVFSGLMSLYDVPKWLVPVKETANYRELFDRKPVNIESYKLPVNQLFNDKRLKGIKKVEWKQIDNEPYYFVYPDSLHNPVLVKANNADIVLIKHVTTKNIEAEFTKMLPEVKYKTTLLTETDGYVRFNRLGGQPLLKFAL